MRTVKWTLIVILVLIVAGFLHYTLPQRDIVRIVSADVRRVDFGANSIFWASSDTGTQAAANRDVRFISAVYPDGDVMVYRNEDTGWGWPPYLKLDSSNLQTEARDLVSSKSDPVWVAMTHYGWRSEFLTIYPNAVGVREVAGPDVRLIPWLNIVILTLLLAILLLLRAMWKQFRERTIDPLIDDAGESWEAVETRATEHRGRLRRWLDGWKRKG